VKVRLAIAALVTAAGAVILPATAAHAQCPTNAAGGSCTAPSPAVSGTGGSTGAPPPAGEPAPAVQATQSPAGTSLPLTGGDVAGLSVIGIGLLAGGTVLVRRARARAPEAND
jgi:LPXTG-motif cell wall-anchored protein